MLNKRAFTLVETVITAALVCGAVVIWTYVLSVTRAKSDHLDNDQMFNSLRASLIYNLKKDIRSASTINKINEKSWEIETVELSKNGLPFTRKIKYELSDDGTKIYMSEEGKKKTYDFSKILPGKKINFKILP